MPVDFIRSLAIALAHHYIFRMRNHLLSCLLAACGLATAARGELLPATTYLNPIIAVDFADPMILTANDGYYYAYATGSADGTGRRRNISVTRSRDLVHWDLPIDAMPNKPGWADRKQNFWAPHAVERSGFYYLFYSAEPNESAGEHLRLGVARARSPQGPFQDLGHPFDTGWAEENIDPMVFTDPVSHRTFLYWGRDGRIAVQELNETFDGFRTSSRPIDVLSPSAKPYEAVTEGPFVIRANGWYYLFVSGDDCCRQPHYAVSVARAKSPLGPFERLSGTAGQRDGVILRGNGRWTAPGHNAVFQDHVGHWWIVYHAVDRLHPRQTGIADLRRMMFIDPLFFANAWPTVRDGTPSTFVQPGPR